MKTIKVAIFGGGISGLTVAHELAELSNTFKIDLFEKNEVLGGKARSMYTEDGFPAEHSARTIHSAYYHLRDTLKRIPFKGKAKTVFNNVVPTIAGSYKFFMLKDYDQYVLPHYFPWTRTGWHEYALYRHKIEEAVPREEMQFFLKKIFKVISSCYERRCNDYDNISWDDYLDAKHKSQNYYKCLLRLPEFYVAARGSARASSMGILLARAVFFPFNHPLKSQTSATDVFNGPVSDVFINPWGDYLRQLNVNIQTKHSVQKINIENNKIKSVSVFNENSQHVEEITSDIYVFALPIETMQTLTKDVSVTNAIPTMSKYNHLKSEPSSGIQFFSTTDVSELFPKGWVSFLDSPWAILGIYQSKKLWPNTHFKEPIKGILSLTWSNFTTPGVLYNKPAYLCTAEEMKNEILAQVRMHKGAEEAIAQLNIHTYALDDCINFAANNGPMVSHKAPLFVPYPGSRQYQPEAYTEVNNVFIAGDYTNTGFDITTMEAANESGRRAVNAILEKNNFNFKPCFVLDKDQNGLIYLNVIDKLLYKLQRKK